MEITDNEIICCGQRLSSADIELSEGYVCEDDDCNYVLETTILTATCPICGDFEVESFWISPEEDEDLLEYYLKNIR